MDRKQYGLALILALITGLLGGVVSSHFLLGQTVYAEKQSKGSKIVEADEFRVVDKEGVVRARLALREGDPTMGGAALISKELDKTTEPSLELYGKDGKLRAFFSLANLVESPMVGLGDRKGKQRARFFLMSEGNPSLALLGEDERVLASFYLDTVLNEPVLSFRDEGGTVRAKLGFSRSGIFAEKIPFSLLLFDEYGKLIWHAP